MPAWTLSADIVGGVGGALVPWVSFQIIPYGGGSTLSFRWSDVPVALRDGLIEPYVLEWTRVVRALADDYGNFENQQFGWTVSDVERVLLDLTHDAAYKYWSGQLCSLSLCNMQGLDAGDTPMTIARGVVRTAEIIEDRKLKFVAEDLLSTEFSSTYMDELVPRRRILSSIFTDVLDGTVLADGSQEASIAGLPEPTIYGLVSDADLAATARKGACPGLPVGTETISLASWTRVLIAGHACKAIDTVYLGGVAVDSGRFGVDILCPGKAGWPFGTVYRDIGGRRYTMIYLIGPAAASVNDGTAPLTADVQGVESVGDGSGTLLTYLCDQYYHWLKNFAFADYQTGAWLTAPTYDDSTPLIDTAGFTTAISNRGYVGGGIVGANGDLRTKKAWIGAWNTSGDLRSGFNRSGQFIVTDGEPKTPVAAFTETTDIIAGSMKVEQPQEAMRNVVPYSYRRDWPRAAWTVSERKVYVAPVPNEATDAVRELWFVRSVTVADDVATHFLHRKMYPPRRIAFETGLHGLLADLGDTVTVHHSDGTDMMATDDNELMVERLETDIALGVVRLVGFDYTVLDAWPITVDFLPGVGQASVTYSYGTGTVVSGGGGSGTTVIVNQTNAAAPVWFGGGEDVRTRVATASTWVRAFNGGEVIFDSAKMPGTIKLSILMIADDATAGNAQCRVVASNTNWVSQTVCTPACVNVTDGVNWVWQELVVTLQSGVYGYRLEMTSSVSASEVGFRAYLQW